MLNKINLALASMYIRDVEFTFIYILFYLTIKKPSDFFNNPDYMLHPLEMIEYPNDAQKRWCLHQFIS